MKQGENQPNSGVDTNTKLFEAIEMASASGVPSNMLASVLVGIGWPEDIVTPAVNDWLYSHAPEIKKTDFKTWVKKYQKMAYKAIAVVVLITIVQSIFALLEPWPMKIMADSAFGDTPAPGPLEALTGKPELIAVTAVMSIVIFIVGASFRWVSEFFLLKIGFTLNRAIKRESFRHILHLPLYHQERLAKGDYVYRQNVVTDSLSDLVLETTSSIISSVIMILSVIIIMAYFNLTLTLVSLILIPLLYFVMRWTGPHLGQYAQELTELNSTAASTINEAVDNAETVQTFTLEDKQEFMVNEVWQDSYIASRKSMFWGNVLENMNSLLVIVASSIVMYFGGVAAMNGSMTFGELFIFMTYMGYLLGPVQSLVEQVSSRFQKKIDVGRIYEVLVDHEGIEDLRQDKLLPGYIQGAIDLRNVSYSYAGQLVFENLNLHIDPGEKVAIIGPSGSGKSTILKLLPLFIEPQAGQVTIDGYDVQSVSLRDLRRRIGWVSQTPQLFTGSVAENLYDGDIYREITVDEIKYAIEVSNVLEFIVKMPMGINSPVGENGSSLSGGQRQRVAIARALIKNAPILCLDEPTAALDAKSENYIRDSLAEIIQQKTVLMVTHRRSLLALMDTIYVLDEGVLRNVNELGGLDYYLSVLEGIAEAQIEREMADDQNYIIPEVVDQHIGLSDATQPIQQIISQAQTATDSIATTSSTQITPSQDIPNTIQEEVIIRLR